MKTSLLIGLMLIVALTGSAQKKKRKVDFCTVEGGHGAARCGGQSYMACVELHEDICGSEDVLPSCCAASPLSADQTAVSCHCCAKKANLTSKETEILQSYDVY